MENKNTIIGVVAISVIFVLFIIVLIIAMTSDPTKKPNETDELINTLKEQAISGSVEAAQRLSELKSSQACDAMIEIVEQCDNVEVKIACLQGLGQNKYFKSGPVLFKIMEKDDNVAMRHNAYLAANSFCSDYFYNARAHIDVRKDKVLSYRREWEFRKDKLDAAGGEPGK